MLPTLFRRSHLRATAAVLALFTSGVVHATAIGHTPGSFGVSSSGAAQYEIALAVPPGLAGLQPSLSLNYSSRRSNGLLGMGWAVAGLSTIKRCRRNLEADGEVAGVTITSSDRFCLDGNKLRVVTGTYGAVGAIYQTEIETYSRITSNSTAGNGPAWFSVQMKDGLTYEYGNSTDSRIEALGSANVRTWALSKIADRSGNYVLFYYTEDATNGSYRPDKIEYTGSASAGPTHRVQFVYETRPTTDVNTAYLAGFKVKETNRLLRIEVRFIAPDELIRKYEFAYTSNTGFATQRSRLASITECDATDCFPATTIAWQAGASGWAATAVTSGVTLTPAQGVFAHAIDINGDGRDDLVYPTTGSGGKWRIMLAAESGGYSAPIVTAYSDVNYVKALPIDANGDGKEDLIVPAADGKWWWLHHTTGTSFSFSTTAAPATGAGGKAWVADVDGDGLEDLLSATTTTISLRRNTSAGGAVSFATTTTIAWQSTTGQFGHNYPFGMIFDPYRAGSRSADFNGDGRADLLVYMKEDTCGDCGPIWAYYYQVLVSTGTTFTALDKPGYSSTPITNRPLVVDINGDGRSDVALNQNVYISNGWAAGAGGTLISPSIAIPGGTTIGNTALVSDWDGDGYQDLLVPVSNLWYYLRSTGETIQAAVSTGRAANGTGIVPKSADVDGDGLREIVFDDAPITSGVWKYYRHNGPFPDLLAAATDGFGKLADFDYKAITDDSVYTPQTTASVPQVRDYEGPLQVVSQTTASDGIGGTFAVSYTYEGAKVSGRGFLGINKRTMIDDRNGLRTVDTYRDDYPWIGVLQSRIGYQSATSSDKTVEITNTWSANTFGFSWEERKYPYVSQTERKQFEIGGPLNGNEITRVTTSVVVDSWGTPTDVTETTLEIGGNSLTTRTQHPIVLNSIGTNWCLSRPQRTEITNTTPAGAATRVYAANWDSVKCRVTSNVVQPDDVAPLKVTTDYVYDSFGNRSTITVTGAGMSGRTTTIDYGTSGRFPETITNVAGHVEQLQWNTRLGLPTQRTDANGLVTKWAYDAFGRLAREERPDATATEWVYGSCVSGCEPYTAYEVTATHKTWPGATVSGQVATEFDTFARKRRTKTTLLGGVLSYARTEYDNLGRVSRFDAPRWSGGTVFWTTYTYDLLNRVTKAERPVDDSSTVVLQNTSYAYEGLTSRETDAESKVTTRIVDGWGRIVQMTDSVSGNTYYQYDPFSNLTRTTDPGGNQIVLTYDTRGRKKTSQDPDMGYWTYDYSSLSELTTQTDAKLQQATFEYDALSRLMERTESEGITQWNWDAAGKPKGQLGSITHPESYSETYTYDAIARPSQVSTVADGTTFLVDYSYDAWGRLETVKYPASNPGTYRFQTRNVYDAASGILKEVVDHAAPSTVFWQAVSTNARGQVIDETLGNTLSTIRSIDEVTGGLDSVATGSGSVQDLGYTWDKVGNLTAREDQRQSKTESFTYDSLFRLTSATGGDAMTVTYDTAGLGNIASKTGVGTYDYTTAQPGCSYYSHGQPHAVRKAGGTAYCYDENGNTTTRGSSNLTWTSYNLPKKIHSGSDYAEFRYGPHRSRYKQTNLAGAVTETSYYIGGVYERLTRSSPSLTEHKHYVVANGDAVAIVNRRSSGVHETVYLHRDHLGSVDTITDATGGVSLRLSYDALGKRRDNDWTGSPDTAEWTAIGNTTRRGLTFHEHLDTVALIHMNGRVYDADLGRFVSADPFVPEPLNSQSLNRYSYVNNGPLSYVDPTGYSGDDIEPKRCYDVCEGGLNIRRTGRFVGPTETILGWGGGGVIRWSGQADGVGYGGYVNTAGTQRPRAGGPASGWDPSAVSQTVEYDGAYDAPIEPLYPLENAALFIYGGGVQAVRGLWTLGRGAYAGVRAAVLLRATFSGAERAIIRESATILSSAEFGAIRAAHAAGTSTVVSIGGRTIQYEAGVTVGNAMSNQAGNGFALFGGAFASETELATAVATELFRLQSGTLGRAAAGSYAADATAAAYGFSERAAEYVLAIAR